MFRWILFLNIVLVSYSSALANTHSRFETAYRTSKNFNLLIEKTKDHFTKEDILFFKKKALPLKSSILPPAQFLKNEINFTIDGHKIVLKILADDPGFVLLNEKKIDLRQSNNAADTYNIFYSVLQNSTTANFRWSDLVINRAEAAWFIPVIGALVSALGYGVYDADSRCTNFADINVRCKNAIKGLETFFKEQFFPEKRILEARQKPNSKSTTILTAADGRKKEMPHPRISATKTNELENIHAPDCPGELSTLSISLYAKAKETSDESIKTNLNTAADRYQTMHTSFNEKRESLLAINGEIETISVGLINRNVPFCSKTKAALNACVDNMLVVAKKACIEIESSHVKFNQSERQPPVPKINPDNTPGEISH